MASQQVSSVIGDHNWIGILNRFIFFGCFVLITIKAETQGLPDLVFQNIDLWPDRNGAIQVLEDSEGYLWITSALGVHRYDGREVRSYYQQTDTFSISGNYTEMLFEDREHNIWIGTTSGGIDRYDRDLDRFERIIPSRAGIGHVVRMIQDKSGNYWLAGATGLFSMQADTDTLVRFVPHTQPKDKSGYGFRGLARDVRDPDKLFVTGLDGAYHFDMRTGEFTSLAVPTRGNGTQYMLMDVYPTGEDGLWCASWFGGIMSCQISRQQWDSFVPEDRNDGRWYDVVKAILPFDDRRLWVSGGAGFGVFDMHTRRFAFYTPDKWTHHGLDSSFSYAGICMTRQNCVVVTRLTGISISSPLNAGGVELAFAPQLHKVEVEGRSYLPDTAVNRLSDLFLDEHERNIAFTFSTPGCYTPSAIAFEYKMEGYDRDWQSLREGRMVRYTNLPRGDYTFQYRARVEDAATVGDQEWLEGRPVRIVKAVAFYREPWFYLAGSATAAILVAMFYSLRVQRIRNEARLKTEFNKKLADTEMALLRSQMNPHFMFNSLNSIKYYILNEEPENANKYLTKFSKLMRLVLKNSQSRLISLSDELEALKLYIDLEALRFKEEFTYRIDVDEGIRPDDTFLPPLIVQPYVENAIWHGLLQKNAPGALEVNIQRVNGVIRLEVADDGIGREAAGAMRSKSVTKKSFGTRITRDRIALVRQITGINASVETIDLHNGREARGTRVIIEIPYISAVNADLLNTE